MDRSERLELKVGLLVAAGLAATVIMILVSDAVSFQGSYEVTAYLPSASQLREGSRVEYSGLPIGTIKSLSASEDAKGPIRAILSIDDDKRLPTDVILQVEPTGLFGDGKLSFSGGANGSDGYLPQDGSAEVVATPGFFDQATQQMRSIMTGVNSLLSDRNIDRFESILVHGDSVLGNADAIAANVRRQNESIARVIANLDAIAALVQERGPGLVDRADSLAEQTQQTMERVDERIGELTSSVEALMARSQSMVSQLEALATSGQALIAGQEEHIDGTLGEARQLVARLDRLAAALEEGRGVLGQLIVSQGLADDLTTAVINARNVSEQVAEQPQVLVWGPDDDERDAARRRRERELQRRAYFEGRPVVEHPIRLELVPPRDDADTAADD